MFTAEMGKTIGRGDKSNQWYFELYDNGSLPTFDPKKMSYLIYKIKQSPATNLTLFRGYVWFINRQFISAAKRAFPNAHKIVLAKETAESYIQFCKTNGVYREYGNPPSGSKQGKMFAQVLQWAEEGDISTIKSTYPGLYIRYLRTLESMVPNDVPTLKSPCGLWICHPNPFFMNDSILSTLTSVYMKTITKWWDGYRGEKHVLISDIQPCHAKFMRHFLKIWADRFPFQAEYKGAGKLIRPLKIIVTSSFMLDHIFSPDDARTLQTLFDVSRYDTESNSIVHIPKQVNLPMNEEIKNYITSHVQANEEVIMKETAPSQKRNVTQLSESEGDIVQEAGPSCKRTQAEMELLNQQCEEDIGKEDDSSLTGTSLETDLLNLQTENEQGDTEAHVP